MPRPRPRVCPIPGCPTITTKPRCNEHQREHERNARATTPTKINRSSDQARRATTVREHRQTYGNWCPGYKQPAHTATDLTADHITEQQHGGPADGPLQVLCRHCNSHKAADNQWTWRDR